jgi:phenylacetate-CoA ligase
MIRALASLMFNLASDMMHGTNTLLKYARLKHSQWWPPDKIRKLQMRKLRNLLNHAYATVPFYKRRFDDAGITTSDIQELKDIEQIPPLTKEEVRHHKHDLVSKAFSRNSLISGHTGGSTGLPIHLYRDANSAGWASACMLRFEEWIGLKLGEPRITIGGGSLGGILRDENRVSFMTRIRDEVEGRYFFQAFELDKKSIEKISKIIHSRGIRAARGYPSALSILANFSKGNITHLGKIEKCVTTAEKLFDFQRNDIEQGFSANVYDQYGSGEIYSIANQCERRGLYHVNDEHVLVESVQTGFNRSGMVPAIITDLDNYAMPLIRYDLGDILEISERRCECGRTLSTIEQIKGRTYDFLIATDERLVPGVFIPHLFRKSEGFDRFYAYQPSIDELEVSVVPNEAFNREELDRLSMHIRTFLGEDMKVTFRIISESELPQVRSGKLFFVKSDVAGQYI